MKSTIIDSFVMECDSKMSLNSNTSVIHCHDPEIWSWKPRILPIVTTVNYLYDSLEDTKEKGYSYGRAGNPTRTCLESSLALLEEAKYAITFSSGMASVVAVIQLLKPGDHIVCSNIIYGGTSHYFQQYCKNQGFEVTFIDFLNITNFRNIKSLKNVKLFWMESQINPTLDIVDIIEVKKTIHELTPDAILCVDNTFLSPQFLKCLKYGASIVMNSVTKFINGHGDVTMGYLATNTEELYAKLKNVQNCLGSIPSPFDCYLVSRSLKTFRIRMFQHEKSAGAVAKFLDKHPSIEKVMYPGLQSHPQHELATNLLEGFGGMVSFYIKGGQPETKSFVEKLKIISFCASLGMAESILAYPWNMSHYYVSPEDKIKIGIKENFVRLSVGLENVEDIISDLEQALTVREPSI